MKPAIYALAALATLLFAQSAMAEQAQISTRYAVEVGGVDVMKITHSIVLSGSSYNTAISAKTTGVANWFSDYKISMNSEGSLSAKKLQPASFNRERKKKGKWRGTTVAWTAGKPDITEDMAGDSLASMAGAVNGLTLDPLSLLVKQSLSGEDNPCKGEHRVFDGRDIFDAALSGKPGEEADTIECRVRLNYVAGREVEEAKPDAPKSYTYRFVMRQVEVQSLGRTVWLPDAISGETSGKAFVARVKERAIQ
jgi:hypothetical protein